MTNYESIVSSLPLQVSLYFHWRYSIIFVGFYFVKWLSVKDFKSNNIMTSIFVPIIISLWSLIEIARIYLGYAGNLREQVPHLFGFLFLTIFPQSILLILMMVLQWNHQNYFVVDKVLSIFQVLFIIFQLLFGYISIKNVIHSQTMKFKLRMSQRAKQKKQKILGTDDHVDIDPNDIKQD